MQSPLFLSSGSRRRGLALTGAFVALALAGLVAARELHACPAQAQALQQAQPGMVLMAGDAGDPACVGKRRPRKAND
ncbi:hypothetical protein [Novosphingobium sp. TH158]|uniref:hypothetical protein n=1 Tax=Novosphingobium sp. TH158 TaxID=2067455 RepID=UPI000C79FDAE|nr:hypothetical protein [Novosphingobium sp. TH158]PLK27509.1 hypothetical protein C0V78_11895 [Novosphingobium sp. TH158]